MVSKGALIHLHTHKYHNILLSLDLFIKGKSARLLIRVKLHDAMWMEKGLAGPTISEIAFAT